MFKGGIPQMLSVYTRHYTPCQESDPHARNCDCPKWIRGVLPDEGRVRLSARTANWAEAEDKAKTMERRSRGGYDRRYVTPARAVNAYLDEQEARGISAASLRQSRSFLEHKFLRWTKSRGLAFLREIHTWQIREFRYTWDFQATTCVRWHERLRSFFLFCMSNRWLEANPMDGDLVSVLLGHRSIKMTEKHYLPWVKARQDQLTTSIKRAWLREAKEELMAFPNSAWPGHVNVGRRTLLLRRLHDPQNRMPIDVL
jgi:hypothetical protein